MFLFSSVLFSKPLEEGSGIIFCYNLRFMKGKGIVMTSLLCPTKSGFTTNWQNHLCVGLHYQNIANAPCFKGLSSLGTNVTATVVSYGQVQTCI